jgi:hypothetical protein
MGGTHRIVDAPRLIKEGQCATGSQLYGCQCNRGGDKQTHLQCITRESHRATAGEASKKGPRGRTGSQQQAASGTVTRTLVEMILSMFCAFFGANL